MKNRVKNTGLNIIYLYMLLLFGACTNNDGVLESTIDKISFQSTINGRVVIDDLEDFNSFVSSFSVWAWRKSIENTMTGVFQAELVYKFEGNWKYDNYKYWHKNNIYDFYALYPDTIVGAVYNSAGQLSFERFDIRQTNEYSETLVVDLMQAKKEETVQDTPPEYVNLTFTHMLTNVNIALKMHQTNEEADDVMEVTYVLINGMNCVGSMQEDVWTLSEPSYLWDKLDIPQQLSTTAQPCFSNVLMLPQTIAENQVMLYVLYSYQQEGGEVMTKLLETYLPAGEWKAGQKIVYTGTIQVDNSIVFDTPQVESWGTEQVGGTIIIQ